jgi:hypothetical protein
MGGTTWVPVWRVNPSRGSRPGHAGCLFWEGNLRRVYVSKLKVEYAITVSYGIFGHRKLVTS